MRACVGILISALAVGCASSSTQATGGLTPAELGNRIRVRIEGRDLPGITSADYFLHWMIVGPDGRREAFRTLVVATSGSEDICGAIGIRAQQRFDAGRVEYVESLHGDDLRLVHDVVLPPGHSLCLDRGCYYAYRVIDSGSTMAADLLPEIRLGAITADGARYVEVRATDGLILARASLPAGWPTGGSR